MTTADGRRLARLFLESADPLCAGIWYVCCLSLSLGLHYDHNQVTARTKSEKNFNNKKGESNPRVSSIVFITILAELACIMPVSVADSLESHA